MKFRFITANIEVVTASSEKLFRVLQHSGILLHNITAVDDLTFRFEIHASRLGIARRLLTAYSFEYKVISNRSIKNYLLAVRTRPIFVFGILAMLFLTVYLPTRVLFVQVEGTQKVDSQRVLMAAEQCGVGFGASRRSVRSEQVKNAILQLVPELKWAGIRTVGCTAVISVTERQRETLEQKSQVTNIVASKDGVVCEMTVTRGSVLCNIGDAVVRGQVLVSGTSDLGLAVLKQRAEAEVYATTLQMIEAVYLAPVLKNEAGHNKGSGFSVQVGKKLINLWNFSGNFNTTCGKIYKRTYVQLPGGFRLPVAFVRESVTDNCNCPDGISAQVLLEKYLQSQMIAGQIISADVTEVCVDDITTLNCTYYCREMIGKEEEEEILLNYEQRD